MLKADKESRQYEAKKRRDARRRKQEQQAMLAADRQARFEEQCAAARLQEEKEERERLLKEEKEADAALAAYTATGGVWSNGGSILNLNADMLSDESDDDFAEEDDQLDMMDEKDGVVELVKATLDKIRQSDIARKLGFNEQDLAFIVYESLVSSRTGKFIRVICSERRGNRNCSFTLVHVLERTSSSTTTTASSTATAAILHQSSASSVTQTLSPRELNNTSSNDKLQQCSTTSTDVPVVHVPVVHTPVHPLCSAVADNSENIIQTPVPSSPRLSGNKTPRGEDRPFAGDDTSAASTGTALNTTTGASAVADKEPDKEEIQFQALVAHTGKWEKQMFVHKLIMCAAGIADTGLPIDLPMPAWNLKVFSRKVNKKYFHTYMRRLMTHLHLSFAGRSLHAFWWHVGDLGIFANGAVVLCDWNTGRTIVCRNTGDKLMSDGCNALCRALLAAGRIEKSVDESSSRPDGYPTVEFVQSLIDCTSTPGGPEQQQEPLSPAAIRGIIRTLADDRNFSRTKSQHILRNPGLRRGQATLCRYSLGLSKSDPVAASAAAGGTNSTPASLPAVRLQVHSSDPLSPSKNMAPTSMIQFSVPEPTRAAAVLTYLRTEWFLNKLYDVHNKDCASFNTDLNPNTGTTTDHMHLATHNHLPANTGISSTRTYDPSPRCRTVADNSPRYSVVTSQPPPLKKVLVDGVSSPPVPHMTSELPLTVQISHAEPSGGGHAHSFRTAALVVSTLGVRRGRNGNKGAENSSSTTGVHGHRDGPRLKSISKRQWDA
eukprot:Lankesteria_metandrocarpae@DN916_c0_g1_i1.p1